MEDQNMEEKDETTPAVEGGEEAAPAADNMMDNKDKDGTEMPEGGDNN